MDREIGTKRFHAEIRRTTHGVAHIRGSSIPDVVFGQGYSCAQDHLPAIADQILKVRSERARFFGPGEGDCHLHSDLGYLALDVSGWAQQMADTQPSEIVAIVQAYAAGINCWVAELDVDSLPEWCRGAAWIRPVTELDLWGLYADTALMASGRNLAQFIGSARPPGSDEAAVSRPSSPLLGEDLPGSNGWALGRAVTDNGRGMLVSNPHFPWYGDGKFWECHLSVPGELDVYGASLVGAPLVHIGFNRDVAWTHTFSAGHRFVIYQLDLTADDPTTYRYGPDERSMTSRTVTVEVMTPDHGLQTTTRTLWSSHYGPVVDVPLLGWSPTAAFAIRDINDRNDRFLSQYLAMVRSSDVAELRSAVHEHQGLPWVNVIATDRCGDVWYADPSPVPNLSDEAGDAFERAVDADPITALFFSQRVALLNGSDPSNEWIEHDGARQPGAVPIGRLPELRTDTVVFNSNDPYWVPHPEISLDRGPVMAGLFGRPLSPRTRMNAAVLAGLAPTGPTGRDGRWTLSDLENALLDNRSLLAEQLLDDVIDRCSNACDTVTDRSDSDRVELRAACEVLKGWDRKFDRDSVGAVLWREFLGGFSATELRSAGPLFGVGFDPSQPVSTPHSLADAPSDGPDPIVIRMFDALNVLGMAGIDPSARLGDVQFVDRSGERIELHGANEVEGIVNVVAPIGALQRSDLEPPIPAGEPIVSRAATSGLRVGGYPITYGASIIIVVGFTDSGPVGRGLLTYGQSDDPASPHYIDQLREFSEKRLRPLLFEEQQIMTDPNLRTEAISG